MEIIWPEKYSPANTRIHVSNEIKINSTPEIIWSWLVRAARWPEWYTPIKQVAIEGGAGDLSSGASFTWRIFGVTFSSKVEEFVPYERLAWSARYEGVDAYHAWLIEKGPEGCRVLTEENQNGWLARLNSLLRPSNVSYYHYLWLEALAKKAGAGPPD